MASTIPAVSTFGFTNASAAHSYGTDSKVRRKRYISQNDMLAILDYHNKVRGKVFPPAANMEYMVSGCVFLPNPLYEDITLHYGVIVI